MIEVTLPLALLSPNRTSGEHWSSRSKRAHLHQLVVLGHLRWRLRGSGALEWPAWKVTITRLSTRTLDDDNMVASAKNVRDGVAEALRVDDADPRVRFSYAQERAKAYGVRIRIEPREQ